MRELFCDFEDPNPRSGADIKDLGCCGGGEVGDDIMSAEMVFEGEVLGVEAVFLREGVMERIGVWLAGRCHDTGSVFLVEVLRLFRDRLWDI